MGIMLETYASGPDAVKNMFTLEFHGLPQGVGSSTPGYTGFKDGEMCYRVKTISVPKIGLTTYPVDMKTAKVEMPGGKLDMDPKFTTELRIDRSFNMYKDLVIWRNKLASPDGRIGDDVYIDKGNPANTRCERALIKAFSLGAATNAIQTGDIPAKHIWEFLRVLPIEVPDIAFDYSAGDNITINVVFGFIEMNDYHLKADGIGYDNLNTAIADVNEFVNT